MTVIIVMKKVPVLIMIILVLVMKIMLQWLGSLMGSCWWWWLTTHERYFLEFAHPWWWRWWCCKTKGFTEASDAWTNDWVEEFLSIGPMTGKGSHHNDDGIVRLMVMIRGQWDLSIDDLELQFLPLPPTTISLSMMTMRMIRYEDICPPYDQWLGWRNLSEWKQWRGKGSEVWTR